MSLLSGSIRLGPVLRLDFDEVRGLLLSVERGPGHDGTRDRVNPEKLRVAAFVFEDGITDLSRIRENKS